LRWQSPIGPVRVDLAHPLNDDGDTLVRLHLRVGPDL
jgi:translocation and assembly module TamA